MSALRRFGFALLFLCSLAAMAQAAHDAATLALEHDPGGAGAWPRFGPAGSPPAPPAVALPAGLREGSLLWERHLVDPIYTSTGISSPGALVFTGSYLNPPRHSEAVPLSGDGSADWTYEGGASFYADASRGSDVLASVEIDDSDSTAVVREWRPDSEVPLWTTNIHPCRSLTYQGWASRKPIQVADNGSSIAVALVMYTPAGQVGRLFVYEAGSGTLLVDWPFPAGNVVATAVSSDGRYIAMAGWPTLYVYDRDTDALRWSGAIGSGNDALAISGDGRYLAWGWTNFQLREWTGSSYTLAWSHNPGAGLYVGQCALDVQNSTLAVAWDNGNSFPNQVSLDLYALPSLDLLWSYDYQSLRAPVSGLEAHMREHVDIPSQMLFSPDGQRLAVSSWGDNFPELHVFERSGPEPLFTLDTPGSLFDVDIAVDGAGGSWVTACGKHVHAGTSGRGADLYAVAIPATGTGVDPAAAALDFGLGPCFPNPFNPKTTIEYTLERDGPLRLTVHDAQGRSVAVLLDEEGSAGRHRLEWSGRDDRGRPLASGLYFLRLEAGSRISSRKVLLAK